MVETLLFCIKLVTLMLEELVPSPVPPTLLSVQGSLQICDFFTFPCFFL